MVLPKLTVTNVNSHALKPNTMGDESVDGVESESFKRWTFEEAQALRSSDPSIGPWHLLLVQALVGGLAVLLTWLFFGRAELVWSVLYGVVSVVVPGSLLARGLTRGSANANVATAAMGFLLWEFVKIGVAVVMLAAAPKVVPDLSWPALLVAMIVCMKVNWFVLLWRRKPVVAETKQRV